MCGQTEAPKGFWKEEHMKEMIQKVREDKGGFTLAELLVVVAIIGFSLI